VLSLVCGSCQSPRGSCVAPLLERVRVATRPGPGACARGCSTSRWRCRASLGGSTAMRPSSSDLCWRLARTWCVVSVVLESAVVRRSVFSMTVCVLASVFIRSPSGGSSSGVERLSDTPGISPTQRCWRRPPLIIGDRPTKRRCPPHERPQHRDLARRHHRFRRWSGHARLASAGSAGRRDHPYRLP